MKFEETETKLKIPHNLFSTLLKFHIPGIPMVSRNCVQSNICLAENLWFTVFQQVQSQVRSQVVDLLLYYLNNGCGNYKQ